MRERFAAIGETIFRSSRSYELVLFDRLAPEEQELLAELRNDPDFYGVLRPPRGSGRTLKAVSRDTALLLFTLREPGTLPAYALQPEGDRFAAQIAQLVMDGILEVRDGDGFVSGAGALALLGAPPEEAGDAGSLSRLSLAALRYAAALELDDPQRLSARLYFYNRVPVSPRWARRAPDAEATAAYLGAAPGTALARRLAADWQGPAADAPDWLSWGRLRAARRPASGPTYKLYVSPPADRLPRVLEVLVDALATSPASAFKVGVGAAGLLRPDKLVVYFSRFDDLGAAAQGLARKLEGVPAHGVPFTAEIAGDGLLSWGMDPPAEDSSLPWQGSESWRLWVTNHLAVALLEGKRAASEETPPWRFALERLRLDGVDVDRWTPSASMWLADRAHEA